MGGVFFYLNKTFNMELNDWRKDNRLINLMFLLKKVQFVVSLKIWRCRAYTDFYASIPMTS